MTRQIAGAFLALLLLAGMSLGAEASAVSDIPCVAAESSGSGDGCCGEGSADAACSLACAVGGPAVSSGGALAAGGPERSAPVRFEPYASASLSGPPETAPPKSS